MKGAAIGYALFVVALAAIWGVDQFVIPYTDRYLTDMLLRVAICVISVSGLALVLGFTGQFSLGHAGFMAVGAYSSAVMSMKFGVPFPLAVLLGGLFAGVAGLAVGVPSLRLTGDYLAVVTLGFNQIIIVAVQNSGSFVDAVRALFGTPGAEGKPTELVLGSFGEVLSRFGDLGGAQGLTGVPLETNFGWAFTWLLLALVTLRNLLRSPHGRTFAAVRDNEIATRSLGIDTTRVKVTAFVIGAFWAGVAGSLTAFKLSSIFPNQFESKVSIELLAMVVLGGSGSLSGPVLSASLLTLLPEFLRGLAEYRMMIYALLLVVMMIVRPKGLLGTRELSDVILAGYRRLFPVRKPA